jgi:hypothetical protein
MIKDSAKVQRCVSYVHSILKCDYGWDSFLPVGMTWEQWESIIFNGFEKDVCSIEIAEQLAQELTKHGGGFLKRIDGKANNRFPKLIAVK